MRNGRKEVRTNAPRVNQNERNYMNFFHKKFLQYKQRRVTSCLYGLASHFPNYEY